MARSAGPKPHRVFSAYLVAQGVLGLGWWAALMASPTARSWFELWPERPAMLDSLLVADLVVIVGGSFLAAWGLEGGARWAAPVVAFCAGGLVYVTLYLFLWVALAGVGLLCFAVMVPPATLTSWVAVHVWRDRPIGAGTPEGQDSGSGLATQADGSPR